MTNVDFSENFYVPENGQNLPKMGPNFHKLLSLLFAGSNLKITYNSQFFFSNSISGKSLLCKLSAEMLLSNQVAGYFYYQYVWKECIIIFDFLHGVIHQGKVTSETTTFGGVFPGMPSQARTCLDLL